MKPGELEAIAGGYHGDPFSLLGPHREDDAWVVRAYLPQASSAAVLPASGTAVPMQRTLAEGIFEARLEDDPGRYRLRLELQRGGAEEIEDPYRFSAPAERFRRLSPRRGHQLSRLEFYGRAPR